MPGLTLPFLGSLAIQASLGALWGALQARRSQAAELGSEGKLSAWVGQKQHSRTAMLSP